MIVALPPFFLGIEVNALDSRECKNSKLCYPSLLEFKKKKSEWSAPDCHVCGRAHCGSVCGLFVFWIQIALESVALFDHGGFYYMCFTLMFHR